MWAGKYSSSDTILRLFITTSSLADLQSFTPLTEIGQVSLTMYVHHKQDMDHSCHGDSGMTPLLLYDTVLDII